MQDVRLRYRVTPLRRGEDIHRASIRLDCPWTQLFMEYIPRRMRLRYAPHHDGTVLMHRLDDDEMFEVTCSHVMEAAVGHRRPDGWRVYVHEGQTPLANSHRGRHVVVHRDLVGPRSTMDFRVLPWTNR